MPASKTMQLNIEYCSLKIRFFSIVLYKIKPIPEIDSDKKPLFKDVENLYITYAICHIASMTSAISNPILYGFMNENFREEFSKIWKSLKQKSICCEKVTNIELHEIPRVNGNQSPGIMPTDV